jgi:hypothetical protein
VILLPATTVYAALLALLFVGLSVRVIRLRRREGVALGGGEREPLTRAVRAHGNFAEYVPLALLLVAMVELSRPAAWIPHGFGLLLIAGRVLHAVGISRTPERFVFRTVGMAMTFGVLAGAAVFLLALRVM